jgi:glycosyltransferase involved in cell wall biosynthesis
MKERIAIGICTYQRPVMLKAALDSLAQLQIPEGLDAHLILVDNDPHAPAEKILSTCAFPFETHFLVENQRGVASTRNRILTHAATLGARWLAFIDDDEEAKTDWLAHLVKAIKAEKAHAVSGNVMYKLPESAPNWMKKEIFFESTKKRHLGFTGGASTNNVLIDLEFVKAQNLSFDPRLDLIGSADTLFFQQLQAAGGKIIWCKDACTLEKVPVSRANYGWLMKRAYKVAFARYHRLLILKGKAQAKKRTVSYLLDQLISFLGEMIIYGIRNKTLWVRTMKKWYKVKGACSALTGGKYSEYDRIHGE